MSLQDACWVGCLSHQGADESHRIPEGQVSSFSNRLSHLNCGDSTCFSKREPCWWKATWASPGPRASSSCWSTSGYSRTEDSMAQNSRADPYLLFHTFAWPKEWFGSGFGLGTWVLFTSVSTPWSRVQGDGVRPCLSGKFHIFFKTLPYHLFIFWLQCNMLPYQAMSNIIYMIRETLLLKTYISDTHKLVAYSLPFSFVC